MAAGFVWRLFGTRRSAAVLLEAFARGDEQNRMLAGMSLVRAGARSFDLIQQEIEKGSDAARLVRLLPDIDHRRSRSILERLAAGQDPEAAEAAQQCLTALDRQHRGRPES